MDVKVEDFSSDEYETPRVDIRCRLCGIEDERNSNIFSSPSAEKLITKITTVYPIFIYKNDPLPKMICKKCIFNVRLLYDDIQKIWQIQNKWIEMLRSSEPNNLYLKLVETVEERNSITMQYIKSTFQKTVDKRVLCNSLFLEKEAEVSEGEVNEPEVVPKEEPSATINNFSFDYFEPKSNKMKKNEAKSNIEYSDEVVINELHKLPYKEVDCPECGSKFRNESLLAIHRADHLKLSLPKLFGKKMLSKGLRRGRLINEDDKKLIRCLNCWKLFSDNKEILNHWSLLECDYFCNICGLEFPNNPKDLRDHVMQKHKISYRSLKQQREKIFKPIVRITPMKYPIHQLIQTSTKPSPAKTVKPPTPSPPIPPVTPPSLPLPSLQPVTAPVPPLVATSAKPKQSDVEVKKIIAAKVVKMAQMSKTPTQPEPRQDPLVQRNPTVNTTFTSFITQHYAQRTYDPNTCPICNQRFQNGKARNSHMRIHKPHFGMGDFAGNPNDANDPYVGPKENNLAWQIPGCSNSNSKAKAPNSTVKSGNQNYQRPNQAPTYSSSPPPLAPTQPTTQPRGVRTKIVPQREDPNMAGPSSSIKMKTTNDLKLTNDVFRVPPLPPPLPPQRVINTLESDMVHIKPEPLDMIPEENHLPNLDNGTYTNHNIIPTDMETLSYVKSEPTYMDVETDPNDDNGEYFSSIETSSFSICDICQNCFINAEDLRLHKAQLHRVV